MDDLIVVILTLLIAGAGAIGQLKKKKEIPVTPEVQNNPENIWDLFNQEVFAPGIKKEPEYFDTDNEESEPYVNEQGYKFEAINEGGLLDNSDIKVQSPAITPTTKTKVKFSLRKAVIYSEILNRKYI
jgi:hypothetical protein